MYLHNVSTGLGMSINTIDGSLNKFLLQMRKSLYIVLSTLNLNLRLTGDHTETCAGSIEEASVEFLEDMRHLATVIVNYDSVINS
jgi:hypothetical protein